MLDNEGIISLIINYAPEIGIDSDGFVAVTTNDELMRNISADIDEQLTTPTEEQTQPMFDNGNVAKIVAALKWSLANRGVIAA